MFRVVRIKKSFLLFCAFCVLFFSFLYWRGFSVEDVASSFDPRVIYQGTKEKKEIAFSCNIAWGEEYLPALLDIADEQDIVFTFFLEGRWAANHPETVKELLQRGHVLANHGYSHKDQSKLSYEENKEEIIKTEETVYEIANIKMTLFAPPSGAYCQATVDAAEDLGYRTIMWTLDTVDWKHPGADAIIKKITAKAENGAIILMHPTKDMVEALPVLAESLKRQGYAFVSVSDVIEELKE